MDKKIYLTKEGLAEVKKELNYLTKVRRLEITQTLKDICSLNDFLEDTEYYNTKNDQFRNEQKITELKDLLNGASVIKRVNKDKVSVGNKVKLKFLNDKEIETYTIVGKYEIKPFENRISHEAPIAKAILGKKVNDTATVVLKNDEYQVKILRIFA